MNWEPCLAGGYGRNMDKNITVNQLFRKQQLPESLALVLFLFASTSCDWVYVLVDGETIYMMSSTVSSKILRTMAQAEGFQFVVSVLLSASFVVNW
jgi:hypothetical protein